MCELCRCRPAQEVHHIVYRSHLGTSILSNLACLCLQCHNEAHGVNAKDIRKHLLEVVRVK
ncbi:MAG: HNH endonuclease [Erysipelotrichia bacterium]|nr:HNH endonuclease [Erysipelotrichia bacterium]